METLSTAELMELRLLTIEYIGMQFQYWLAMTFAVIAAAHVAGKQMSFGLKLGVSFLYLSSTLLFLWIYFAMAWELQTIVAEYRGRVSIELIDSRFLGLWRMAIWGFGSLGTIWYLMTSNRRAST